MFKRVWERAICYWLNDRRTYVQTQLKKHLETWLLTNPCRNGKLPSEEAFELALTRDWSHLETDDKKSDQEKKKDAALLKEVTLAFDLLIDVLLPQVRRMLCSSRKLHLLLTFLIDLLTFLIDLLTFLIHVFLPQVVSPEKWGPDVRYKDRVSTCKVPDGPEGALRITASSEAVAVLLVKNNHSKWEAMYKHRHINKNFGAKMPAWKKTEEKENVEFKTKWSDSNCGQNKFGGWKTEGMHEFVRLCNVVKTARANEFCAEVEEACIERLKEKPQCTPAQAKQNAKAEKVAVTRQEEDIVFEEEV